jgi:hypothetical protein
MSVFISLISPVDLGMSIVSTEKVVDFPAPFGPSKPTTSFFWIPKLVPPTAG